MKFRVYVPTTLTVPSELVLGLAERANKRLGYPLQRAVCADDLLEQAELEQLIDPLADGTNLDAYHDRYWTRSELLRLRTRAQRRADMRPILEASVEHERRKREDPRA